MKKLEIAITKAQLKSFTCEIDDGELVVRTTIGLYTDGGKPITDYTISTRGWNEDSKFELPLSCIQPIHAIAKSLEHVVTAHCQDNLLALEEVNKPAYEF